MHKRQSLTLLARTALLLIALLAHAVAKVRETAGDEKVLLRWDLPQGSVWTLHVHQQGETRVGFSGKVAETRYDLKLDLTLRVVAHQQDGVTIHQTVDRVVFQVTPPTGTTVQFDSTSPERHASGPAADLAAAVRPLVGATFELVQNDRGEVGEVRPVGQVAQAWLSKVENHPGGAASLKGAVTKALGQSLVVLPKEAVGPQDSWQHARTEESPLGQVLVRTTYRLDRPSPQEDKPLWPIRFTSEIELPAEGETKPSTAAAQPSSGQPSATRVATRRNPIQVKQFEQSGTVWFSVEESRPVRAELQSRATLTQVYRDLTITADTKLQQHVALQPKSSAAGLSGEGKESGGKESPAAGNKPNDQ